ncbi:MAG: hypothetical protein EA350_03320 [Gemmatimonadales bacterium]|nr:MAG: hypothetical protein EA350_03320 [Gemmatimonadales bacterium]
MKIKIAAPVAVLFLFLSGCASGGAGTSGSSHFARGLGVATAADLNEHGNRFMALHSFELERDEGPPSIVMESRWRERNLFPDERLLGIEVAEIRATIRARPRSGTSGMGEVYSVDLIVEQRVRVPGESEWNTEISTAQAEELATTMAEDLRRNLNVGVRRF